MSTEKNLLNLTLDEIKSVKLPKIDYKIETSVRKLPSDMVAELKEYWNLISEKGSIAPKNLRSHLREIGSTRNKKFRIKIKLFYEIINIIFRVSPIQSRSFPGN